jgi:L-fucose isomerase-like protein
MKPRIAIIALTNQPDPTLGEPAIEVAEQLAAQATERLTALGAEIMLPVPICAARLHNTHCVNGEDTRRAVAQANAWPADCVILLETGFHTPGLIIPAVREIAAPLVVWAVPNDTWPLVGATLDRGVIADLGIKHLWMYDDIESEAAVRAFDYARGAMIAARLRNTTYGFVGGRAYDMENTIFDPAQLLEQFGVFTHHVDQLELYLRAEAQQPQRVHEATQQIVQGRQVIGVPDKVMERSVRTYLALHDMAEEYRWDFLGVKCQPEMINNYCSVCIGVAQMNDDGIPTACECDTPGILTSYMMSLLVDEPVYFGDTAGLDYRTQRLTLANCGAMAMRLAQPDVPVQLTLQLEAMGPGRGVCTTYQCRAGRVTVARLQRCQGKYSMLLTPGEAVNRPDSERSKNREIWPHAFIELPGNTRALADHLLGNHLHMAYGDHVAALTEACNFLNITPIHL